MDPGFRHSGHYEGEDYERHAHHRPSYGPGQFEYTGQPVGYEHLGSPPKQRLEDMDPKTIAQLGYEGPEGERRKVEAINERIYERDYDRTAYPHGLPPRHDGYEYGREGHFYDKHRNKHGHSSHSSYGHQRRDSDSDEEYAGHDERYRLAGRHGDRYGHGRSAYAVPPPVHVERKVEEDGTVVEVVYPENTSGAGYGRHDPAKIHYGRQDSFPETVLQEAAHAYGRHGRRDYPAGYSHERPPPVGYAPPYNDATSSYTRRPYEGTSSEYLDERHRKY